MHIEFLVEEPSAEAALRILVPRILDRDISFDIHPHQGKQDLLDDLPFLLRGYANWITDEVRIAVVVDRDDDDCADLKTRLEQCASLAGLMTRSTSGSSFFQVLNRITIEELEAWFFGDVEAVRAAYPGVSTSLARRQGFRDPDAIVGGTWEALERVLQRAGHHQGGLRKIEAARAIAEHMHPDRNISRSFRCFRDGLCALVGQA